MALIKCRDCGAEVSDKAFSCPNCGSLILGYVTKSVVIAVLLTILFGPLGMLYSTQIGALVMTAAWAALVLIITDTIEIDLDVEVLIILTIIFWTISIIWAASAASEHNRKLLSGQK